METAALTKLPPEIRNRIYDSTLRQNRPIRLIWRQEQNQYKLKQLHAQPRNIPALIAVCKHIRSECYQLFYAVNSFCISGISSDSYYHAEIEDFQRAQALTYFLNNVTSTTTRDALREVTIDLRSCNYHLPRVVESVQQNIMAHYHRLPLKIRTTGDKWRVNSAPWRRMKVEIDMLCLSQSVASAAAEVEREMRLRTGVGEKAFHSLSWSLRILGEKCAGWLDQQ